MRNKLGQFIKGHTVPKKWCNIFRKYRTGKPSWNKGHKMSRIHKERWLKSIGNISKKRRKEIISKISHSVKNLWKDKYYRERMKEKRRKILNGRIKSFYGYILIYKPEHPFALRQKRPYVPEHRLVMEKHLGRHLKPKEVVHHINGIKDDNRVENLKLFKNHSKHVKYHFPKGSKFGINANK